MNGISSKNHILAIEDAHSLRVTLKPAEDMGLLFVRLIKERTNQKSAAIRDQE